MKTIVSIVLAAVCVLAVTVAVQAQSQDAPTETFIDKASGAKALPCTDAAGNAVDVPRFAVGASFEGLKLAKTFRRCDQPTGLGRANFASYIYGSCDPKPDQGCAPPMEIQTFPACERNSTSYKINPEGDPLPRENVTIAGLPGAIFDDGQRVEIYMKDATVVIFGENRGQIRRAAAVIKKNAKSANTVEIPCSAPVGATAG